MCKDPSDTVHSGVVLAAFDRVLQLPGLSREILITSRRMFHFYEPSPNFLAISRWYRLIRSSVPFSSRTR
jgi:hypothetical protein